METEYRYLLHLLGAYLRQETPEIREDADWKQLIRLSQHLQIRCHMTNQLLPRLIGYRLKGQCRIHSQFRQIDRHRFRHALPTLCAGQGQHVVYQPLHPAGLLPDILQITATFS